MLEKPDLALRMLPTEGMREARAYHLARGMVHHQHDAERATMEEDHQHAQDRFLREAEARREQEKTQQKSPETDQERRLKDIFKDLADRRDREHDRDRDGPSPRGSQFAGVDLR
jgi:hypothetical protein